MAEALVRIGIQEMNESVEFAMPGGLGFRIPYAELSSYPREETALGR